MHRAELLEEIAGRYGVAAEYPWRRYPRYAVFRHAGNRKWFAVLMNPPGRKLGLATEEEVAILNVKIRAEENSLLRGMDAVLPADLPALVATLTHHIADLSATQDNLADSLAAYPPITPPNLCVGFGDGALKADDLIAGILGAVVKDPVQDKIVWQEYLDTVVKQRDGWQDLYRAARDMA